MPLHVDSALIIFQSPVLSEFDGIWLLCGVVDERIQRMEFHLNIDKSIDATPPYHGFRLVALANDYLCYGCQDVFLISSLDGDIDRFCNQME